jgi:pimeloyl-ACP methyl ester carboxylesterase
MAEGLPIVLVPGLNCTARLWRAQIEALWGFGPVTVADHRRDADIKATAARILSHAPPRFALAGLSYGGYIAFEIMRQAANRVAKLALLDTGARPETPQQTELRRPLIAHAASGRFSEVAAIQFPRIVHPARREDASLKRTYFAMVEETGPEAYLREQKAIMDRPDSRPLLASIRCPTLALVGDADEPTPPELAEEIAAGIPGARLVVVPDCGHLSTLERPEAVNAALVEWLEK